MKRLLFILALLSLAWSAGAQRGTATVSGYITDADSGETLLGAGVLLANGAKTPTGAVTNVYGYYTLTIPRGATTLQYSYVGYSSETVELNLQRDTTINIILTPSASLEEAVVVAQKDAGIQSTYLGAIDIPLNQIKNTPVVFGEADVLKAIQLMPGVQGGNEGFTGLYVRGGGADENLVLLDGVPIYNVDHMLGILSVFQTEAVKKVTLYKGSFPARYGGRVSSIVDIRTNDGNMKETHGSVGIGALTEKLHLEGPILKDRLSYSISGRGLHTLLYDPIIRAVMGKGRYGNYFFYDLSGKITWRLSDKDRFFLGGYSGLDKMGLNFEEDGSNTQIFADIEDVPTNYFFRTDMSIGWGNNVASLRWNHIFSNKLFSNTTVAFNQYKMLMHMGLRTEQNDEKVQFDVDYNSGIRDWSAKLDFDYVPTPAHLIKFGAEYTYHTFVPETLTAVMSESINEQTNGEGLNYRSPYESYVGHDMALYAEDDFSIGSHFTVNPGLYASLFLTDGKPYFNLQPRLSAKYSLDNGLSFKAGYARMAQYVHLLSSFSISLPLDLWVPITKDIKPVTSDQVSAGIYFDGLPGWEFSLEGYWKHIDNLLEYKDGTIVLGNSMGWESKVEMGQGRAFGLELMAQKTKGKLTGWVAYTLAKSDRIFPDGTINLGRRFPYKYDRRHNFNINVSYQLGKHVELNAAWIFASGGTTTIPLRQTVVLAPDFIYDSGRNGTRYGILREADFVEERNNYRLPPSHRLNLGVNFLAGTHWVFNVSVYNLYNNMNPNLVYVDYETARAADGTYYTQPVMQKVTILPIMPSLSITYKF